MNPRTLTSCALVTLGALLLTCAAMIPTYTLDKVAKTPLDLAITTVAASVPGEPSNVLDAKSLTSPEGAARVDSGVPLVSQRFVTVEEPSDATQMTIQAGQTLRRDDRDGTTGLLTASVDRISVDRKTGEPVSAVPNGTTATTVDTTSTPISEPVHRTGLQYRFPLGTEKKSYPYFDLNARKTFDIEYLDETEIDGVTLYHFRQTVPTTNMWEVSNSGINQVTLPAAKWGLEGDETITMTRFYTNTRDIWVEPQTGTIVDGGEQIFMYFSRTPGKPELTMIQTHLVFDQETIDDQLAIAQENIDKIRLFGRQVPIALAVTGLVVLAAGVLLGLRAASPRARSRAR